MAAIEPALIEKQKSIQEATHAWTFKRLADDYLSRSASNLSPLTISERRQQLRDFVLGRIGQLPAKEVTPADIVDVVERSGHKSLHVARLVLITIREIYAHGVARHVVEANPCAHIQAKAIIGAPPSRRARIMLSDDELGAMLPALPGIGRSNELAVKLLLPPVGIALPRCQSSIQRIHKAVANREIIALQLRRGQTLFWRRLDHCRAGERTPAGSCPCVASGWQGGGVSVRQGGQCRCAGEGVARCTDMDRSQCQACPPRVGNDEQSAQEISDEREECKPASVRQCRGGYGAGGDLYRRQYYPRRSG